jgi:hypothetical protein
MTGHEESMGDMRNVYKILLESLKARDLSEDLDTNRRIILKRILKKEGGKLRTGFIWLRIGTSGKSCERINEPSGFIQCADILD